MKNKQLLIGFILMGVAWALIVGYIVGRVFGSDDPLPMLSGNETYREEYDIVIASETNPKTLLVLDFIETDGQIFGSAHLLEDINNGNWKSTDLDETEIEVNEVQDMNNFVNKIHGRFEIDGKVIEINVPRIYTPMVIRSEKLYSKFGGATSEPSTYMNIDGEGVESRASILRALNYQDFEIDIESLGVNTEWIMFWDANNDFYHLDKTTVKEFHPYYKSHEFYAKILRNNKIGNVEHFPEFQFNREGNTLTANNKTYTINSDKGYSRTSYAKTYLLTDGANGIGVYLSIGDFAREN